MPDKTIYITPNKRYNRTDVLNSLPNPDEYIGWVYTPLGWFGFGKIESLENEENAFITADDYKIQTVDGDIFCYKTT